MDRTAKCILLSFLSFLLLSGFDVFVLQTPVLAFRLIGQGDTWLKQQARKRQSADPVLVPTLSLATTRNSTNCRWISKAIGCWEFRFYWIGYVESPVLRKSVCLLKVPLNIGCNSNFRWVEQGDSWGWSRPRGATRSAMAPSLSWWVIVLLLLLLLFFPLDPPHFQWILTWQLCALQGDPRIDVQTDTPGRTT